jgi:N-acyl-D-aspartate/D-glutamate deacylase
LSVQAGGFRARERGGQMDVLIRNGKLVDGTGAPAREADIAIEKGRVTAIAGAGECDVKGAAEVIEATRTMTARRPGTIGWRRLVTTA